MRMDGELEIPAGKDRSHSVGHADRNENTKGSTDHGGYDVIAHALGQERLHQVPALGANSSGHAHFRLPFGGEHDEDHDNEEHAGPDREKAEQEKECGHEIAEYLGLVNSVFLAVPQLEV